MFLGMYFVFMYDGSSVVILRTLVDVLTEVLDVLTEVLDVQSSHLARAELDQSSIRERPAPSTTNSAAGKRTIVLMPQCPGVSDFIPGHGCCLRSGKAFDLDA
jgi:hypothetical protein